MSNIETRLALFHNLFLICLIGAVVFLVIAVVIFVRLQISQVFGYFTGTHAKREIKRLKEAETKEKPKSAAANENAAEIRRVDSSEIPVITVTQRLEGGKEQISVLDSQEATVLLLQKPVSFYIEREIIFIHTDEIVE